jgi:hypothetical protein
VTADLNGDTAVEIRRRLAERHALADAEEIARIKTEIEAENAAQERLETARAEVAAAREAAVTVNSEVTIVARDVADLLQQLAVRIQRLEQLKHELEKCLHIEAWHIQHNFPRERSLINPALLLPKLASATSIKIGLALARMTGSNGELDNIRARQLSWDQMDDLK